MNFSHVNFTDHFKSQETLKPVKNSNPPIKTNKTSRKFQRSNLKTSPQQFPQMKTQFLFCLPFQPLKNLQRCLTSKEKQKKTLTKSSLTSQLLQQNKPTHPCKIIVYKIIHTTVCLHFCKTYIDESRVISVLEVV